MRNGDRRVGWQRAAQDTRWLVFGAVAHAMANVTGVSIKDLPITPEKILKAFREKCATEKPVPA